MEHRETEKPKGQVRSPKTGRSWQSCNPKAEGRRSRWCARGSRAGVPAQGSWNAGGDGIGRQAPDGDAAGHRECLPDAFPLRVPGQWLPVAKPRQNPTHKSLGNVVC